MTATKDYGADDQAEVEESVPDPRTTLATQITDTAKLLKAFAGEPALVALAVRCFARTAMPLAAEVLALDHSDTSAIVADVLAALNCGVRRHDQ